MARLVQERADRLTERLRASVPDLRARVRHDHVQSAIIHGSWVELNRDAERRDTDDVVVELLFMRDGRRATVTIYDRDQSTLVDEDLPFDPAAGAGQALAAAQRALALIEEHVAEIEAELRAAG
ncbi:hypothetical protein [Phytohabitans kaempferiae]|uniref:Uncharacterized protein n=1 Tax=Phytohabitans kaempferiae TaxID=1620943 RepID=A0ABV6MB09_9ACTN